jgi:NAD(P)-dependent dehydrogenase (short-subunit alcohol dehydrogenase family)
LNFQDGAAIVTGGASGLGAATAASLAALGTKVSIFDRDAHQGREVARSVGGQFFFVDVTDEDSVSAGFDAAIASHGPARILVNCAGIGKSIRTVNREGQAFPLADFRRIVDVNLIGTFNVIAKFAARLHRADVVGEERGVIINTSSIAAFEGQIGQAAYAASKGGIVGMTLPIARDLAQLAIRVVTIAPGLFLTPAFRGMSEAALQELGKQAPFPKRLGHPSEYALLVEAIIRNPMLNGAVIRLDGAIRMAPR